MDNRGLGFRVYQQKWKIYWIHQWLNEWMNGHPMNVKTNFAEIFGIACSYTSWIWLDSCTKKWIWFDSCTKTIRASTIALQNRAKTCTNGFCKWWNIMCFLAASSLLLVGTRSRSKLVLRGRAGVWVPLPHMLGNRIPSSLHTQFFQRPSSLAL